MAKKMAANMKAAWVAAKKDFSDSPNAEHLKRDVVDVLDFARNKAAMVKRSTDTISSKSFSGSGGSGSGKAQPRVNQDVGSELLTHFKDEWADIHNSTTTSSLAINKMESDLHNLSNSLTKSHALIKSCWMEFAKLKEIIEVLDEAQSKVSEVGELVQRVEEAIHEYSLTKAELEKERQKHSLQKQHEKVIAENNSKVDQMRKILANEQQLSVALKFEMDNKEMKERQSAFQEMFDRQMEDYRKKGEVDQPISEVKVKRSMSQLEEVEIEDEDGKASLHEFLSDVVVDQSEIIPADSSEAGGQGKNATTEKENEEVDDSPEKAEAPA